MWAWECLNVNQNVLSVLWVHSCGWSIKIFSAQLVISDWSGTMFVHVRWLTLHCHEPRPVCNTICELEQSGPFYPLFTVEWSERVLKLTGDLMFNPRQSLYVFISLYLICDELTLLYTPTDTNTQSGLVSVESERAVDCRRTVTNWTPHYIRILEREKRISLCDRGRRWTHEVFSMA